MDEIKFKAAYGESRNGCNGFIRHPLSRKFLYSDGVEECAQAGCWWLLDILATELPAVFRANKIYGPRMIVTVTVKDGRAVILGQFDDNEPNPYRRKIDRTDMPEGEWQFWVADDEDGEGLRCVLLSER